MLQFDCFQFIIHFKNEMYITFSYRNRNIQQASIFMNANWSTTERILSLENYVSINIINRYEAVYNLYMYNFYKHAIKKKVKWRGGTQTVYIINIYRYI